MPVRDDEIRHKCLQDIQRLFPIEGGLDLQRRIAAVLYGTPHDGLYRAAVIYHQKLQWGLQ